MRLNTFSITKISKVLTVVVIQLTFSKAKFWVSPVSNDSCWTSQLEVKSKELFSELMCAMYCANNICESYHFINGLCEISHSSVHGINAVEFEQWQKKGETREIARNKPARSSPYYTNNYPEQAVDGNTTLMFHSGDSTPKPWLLIDLENNFWVSKIRILLQTYNGFQRRAKEVQILLGAAPPPTELDFSQYTEVGYIGPPLAANASWQEFEVTPPLCSRYVIVTKKVELAYDGNLLQLFELEVFASL